MMEDLVRQLLPKNATALERAAVETLYERIDEIALVIASIWNPRECPVEFLPWLAWVNSVDVWDDNRPESVKRDVIAAAPMVHRKKSTLLAVELALKALGIRSEISEWWQKVPEARRGTFEITAFANLHLMPGNVILSEEVQLQVLRQIRAAKPKSRAFTFQIGAELSGQIAIATGAAGAQFNRSQGAPDTSRQFEASVPIASAASGASFSHMRATPDTNARFEAGVAIQHVVSGAQFGRFTAVASN